MIRGVRWWWPATGLRSGRRLRPDDLTVARADLPSIAAAESFPGTDQLVGRVTVAPLAPGDLIERSAVVAPQAAPGRHVLSFPVDRERALDGDLQPGESVDVLATYGTGEAARTVVVARGVQLVDVVDDSHQSLASTGKLVITVAVSTAGDALRAAHASQAAALTLVRTDETSAAAPGGSYSLPPAGTAAGRTTATTG